MFANSHRREKKKKSEMKDQHVKKSHNLLPLVKVSFKEAAISAIQDQVLYIRMEICSCHTK